MNLTLVSSFIIGTILLLTLVKLNLNLAENSMDSMNDQQAKIQIDAIAGVLSHDFRKIGYSVEGIKLSEATPTRITFKGDMEDKGTVDEVSWEFDRFSDLPETMNPNDQLLTRTVNGNVTPIKLGVVKFELTYFDAYMQPTGSLDDIDKIKVKVVSESTQPVGNKYMSASWEKIFTPMNLFN